MTFECKICGKSYKRYLSQLKSGQRKNYCSFECSLIARRQGLYKAGSPPKRGKYISCLICGKKYWAQDNQIKRGTRYCSKECLGKANGNRLKGKKAPWNGDAAKQKECKICGRTFEFYESQTKNGVGGFCCSRKCADQWHAMQIQGTNNPNWAGGLSYEPYSPEFNKKQKERIKLRDGYVCQLCYRRQDSDTNILSCKTAWNEGLHIHHIDYDKKNNRPLNLISLCRACNMKVNQNRKYWEGHFCEYLKGQSLSLGG